MMDLSSAEAAALKGGGLDLSTLKKQPPIDPVQAAVMKVEAEVTAGLRCMGCQERISEGARMSTVSVVRDPSGQPGVQRQSAAVCSGTNGCTAGAALAQQAECIEPIAVMWTGPDAALETIARASDG